MLRIDSKVFKPIEGDDEFRITLRPIGYSDYQEIRIACDEGAPSGGPESNQTQAEIIKGNLLFMRKIFEASIVKIEGIEVDGKAVENFDALLKAIDIDLGDKIAREIMSLVRAKPSELKN